MAWGPATQTWSVNTKPSYASNLSQFSFWNLEWPSPCCWSHNELHQLDQWPLTTASTVSQHNTSDLHSRVPLIKTYSFTRNAKHNVLIMQKLKHQMSSSETSILLTLTWHWYWHDTNLDTNICHWYWHKHLTGHR